MPTGVKYGRWGPQDMERALAAPRNGDIGLNAAAREYCVSKATLKRHLDWKNYFAVESTQVIGSVEDIPPHVEEQLVHHVLQLEQCMFGTTVTDLRLLAFQVAELNRIPHRFNKEKQAARKKMVLWFHETTPTTKPQTTRSYICGQGRRF
jgi:hypothetical protein